VVAVRWPHSCLAGTGERERGEGKEGGREGKREKGTEGGGRKGGKQE